MAPTHNAQQSVLGRKERNDDSKRTESLKVEWGKGMNKNVKKMVQEYLEKMPSNSGPPSPLRVGGNRWHGDSKSSTQTEAGNFTTWTTKGSKKPTEYTTQVKHNKTVVLQHLSKLDPFDRDAVYEEMMAFVNKDLEKSRAPQKPTVVEGKKIQPERKGKQDQKEVDSLEGSSTYPNCDTRITVSGDDVPRANPYLTHLRLDTSRRITVPLCTLAD
ncbi:hypothetical protein NMY22_g5665 [Coprinellus aureogranulatus]|nr:hypothetical protein NMY22_g5665 [Coprinellus aureogranulatus]